MRLSEMLEQMMAVDPDARPLLSDVVRTLLQDKEAHRPYFQLDRPDAILPEKPIYRSPHHINPIFMQDSLRQVMCVLFVRVKLQSRFKYEMLFSILTNFFGPTYSICEVFGRYDFVVTVWTQRDTICACCLRLAREVLDGDEQAIQAMACEQVDDVGSSDKRPHHDSVQEVLVHLFKAQESEALAASPAVKWLQRAGIFGRARQCEVQKQRIRCFSLMAHWESQSQAERSAKGTLLLMKLTRAFGGNQWDMRLFRRAAEPLPGLANAQLDYVVSYIAPTFDDVIKVPATIAADLQDQRLTVATLLASKRYYVDSDRCADTY